ncbi:MAG: hypothetical protein ABEH59_07885 [Halobacteriales archaeon]
MDFGATLHRGSDRSNHSRGWFFDRVEAIVSAFAYWLTVGLPIVYISLLASGIDSASGLGLFLGLLALHLLALFGGRNYDPVSGRHEIAANDMNG